MADQKDCRPMTARVCALSGRWRGRESCLRMDSFSPWFLPEEYCNGYHDRSRLVQSWDQGHARCLEDEVAASLAAYTIYISTYTLVFIKTYNFDPKPNPLQTPVFTSSPPCSFFCTYTHSINCITPYCCCYCCLQTRAPASTVRGEHLRSPGTAS